MMIERGEKNRSKVLVVDDEPHVLNSLADLLRKEFHVFATDEVDAALRLLQTRTFALVISDQRMPTLTGTELLANATVLCPDTFRILLTAFSDIQAAVDSINKGHVSSYLAKPWDAANLLGLVRNAVRQYAIVEDYRSLIETLARVNSEHKETAASSQDVDQPPSNDLAKDNRVLTAALETMSRSFEELSRMRERISSCCQGGKIETGRDALERAENGTLPTNPGGCPSALETALRAANRDMVRGEQ